MIKTSKVLASVLALSLLAACSKTPTTPAGPQSTPSAPTMGQPTPTPSQGPDMEADVVVVGSGLGGMASAAAAAQSGASVIVIEKQGYLGGGIVYSPGNLMVAEVGDYGKDTLDKAVGRWKKNMERSAKNTGYPDYDRLKKLLEQTMPTIRWLEAMGATFTESGSIETLGMKTVRADVPAISEGLGGKKLAMQMQATAEAAGAKFITDCPATGLIMDGQSVVGVEAQLDGKPVQIAAKKIVLACGGFGNNADMIASMVPEINAAGYFYQGVDANKGEGIEMAREAGAAIYENSWVVATAITPSEALLKHNKQLGKLSAGYMYWLPIEGDPIPNAPCTGRILVDKNGKRFVSEAADAQVMTMAMPDHADAPYYVLYAGAAGELIELLENGLQVPGEVFKGDTLEELAKAAGMGASALKDTVARYNGFVSNGKDTDFGKDKEHLGTVTESGPYYLVHFVCSYVATMGGVKTNDSFQVIREDGGTIEGLYAVGEMAHRFVYNRTFISAASNGFGIVMGKIAGEHAAK